MFFKFEFISERRIEEVAGAARRPRSRRIRRLYHRATAKICKKPIAESAPIFFFFKSADTRPSRIRAALMLGEHRVSLLVHRAPKFVLWSTRGTPAPPPTEPRVLAVFPKNPARYAVRPRSRRPPRLPQPIHSRRDRIHLLNPAFLFRSEMNCHDVPAPFLALSVQKGLTSKQTGHGLP